MKKYETYSFIIFIVMMILGIILLPTDKLNNLLRFSENTILYLFSSLLQANAAILSIVGVFIIYKVQTLQSSVDIIKSSRMTDLGKISWPATIVKFDNFTLEDKKEFTNSLGSDKYLKPILEDWLNKEEKLSLFKENIILPTILITLALFINLLSLLSSYNLYIGPFYVCVRIAFINVLFEIYVLSIVSYYIIKHIRT